MSAMRSGLVLGAGDLEAGRLGAEGREQRAESQRSEVSEQSTSHPCSFIPIRLGIRVPQTIPAEDDQAHRQRKDNREST